MKNTIFAAISIVLFDRNFLLKIVIATTFLLNFNELIAAEKTIVYDDNFKSLDLKNQAKMAHTNDIKGFSKDYITMGLMYQDFVLDSVNREFAYHILKVEITNNFDLEQTIYTSSFFNDRVYIFEYDKIKDQFVNQGSTNGYLVPPEDRSVYYSHSSIIGIKLSPSSTKTYYIIAENHTDRGRVVAKASFKMGFIGYEQMTYRNLYGSLSFINNFMLGIVTILIIYNLLISIWLKDESMAYLVFYNFSYFCWVFVYGGMIIKFNLTDDLEFERTMRYIIPNTTVPVAYGLLFYKFLDLKKNSKVLGYIMMGAIIAHTILNVSSVFGQYNVIIIFVQILSPITYFTSVIVAIIAYRKKQPFAEYFVAGSILMMIGLSIFIYGFSSPNLNYIYGHISLEMIFFLEIIVFSIAVSNKVWRIKKQSVQLATEKELMEDELKQKNRKLISFATEQIEQNDKLEKLKDTLSDRGKNQTIKTAEFIRAIDKMKGFDPKWEEFKLQFENVNPEFFNNLNQQHTNLTQNDLRLCAFLKMGLKRKEIAVILGVSVRAIDKALERMKNKLNLEPGYRITDYINGIATN